jgi:hypothetical protein
MENDGGDLSNGEPGDSGEQMPESPHGFGWGWIFPGLWIGSWLANLYGGPKRTTAGRIAFVQPPPPAPRPDPNLMFRCQRCQRLIVPEFTSCPQCGGPLSLAECRYCGQPLPRHSAECASCGAPVQ